MKRFVIVGLIAATSTLAHAQDAGVGSSSGSLPGSASLSFNYLYLHEGNVEANQMPLSLPSSLNYYFNYAHCECSREYNYNQQPPPATFPIGVKPWTTWYEGTFAYQILLTGQTTPIEAPLQIWAGGTCTDPITPPILCHQITNTMGGAPYSIPTIAQIAVTNGVYPPVNVYEVMQPEPADDVAGGALAQPCTQRANTSGEWAISDVNSDGSIGDTPQYFVNQPITTDSLPPPFPTTFVAEGADSAIQLNWTAPTGDVADIAHYQALCSDMNGSPATGIKVPTPETCAAATTPITSPSLCPKYQTPYWLCGFDEPLTQCTTGTSSLCWQPGCVTNSQPVLVPALATADAPVDSSIDAPPDSEFDAPPDAFVAACNSNPVTPPQGLTQLDPYFICGDVDDATATSMRIEGLTNGVTYMVELVSIDLYGNPSPVILNENMTPEPVNDLWTDLHDRGSQVEGGFCLLAETFGDDNPLTNALRGFRDDNLAASPLGRALIDAYYGSLAKLGAAVHGHLALRIVSGVLLAPLIAVALLWHVLTLPGLLVLLAVGYLARRRLRSLLVARSRLVARVFAIASVALVGLAPARAHAQQPYWEDERYPGGKDDEHSLADEPKQDTWRVALGIGPYLPHIDQQFGTVKFDGKVVPGPYEEMFGTGDTWVPTLTFERVIFRRYGGEWLVGVNGAFLTTSANAWQICTNDGVTIEGCNDMPGDPARTRSMGDSNSFNLIPFAVTASYRLTQLDDEYGVPIVPYARAGLSYYVWWMTDPNGGISSYKGDKADGASEGLQGTLGLSIRAERIDADAARSMRDTGILHAGFFIEYTVAYVDGFGQATKLDVGDNTWFAGIDFDF